MAASPRPALRPDPALADARRRAARVEGAVLRARFHPPARMDACEWADAFLYLPAEFAAEPGKYSSARAPYQREPLRVMSDPRVDKCALMWASQLGKSLILQAVIGHRICIRPRPVLMVQPTIDLAEGWSKERFAPMQRETPALQRLVRDPKSRSGDNTLRLKMFPGGALVLVGSNAPGGLAGRSIADALFDEVDRFAQSAGTEGDAIELGMQRQATYGEGLSALTSTPGTKGESKIEPAFLDGDQRHYFVPCPHCEAMQTLKWGDPNTPYGLKWERAGEKTVKSVAYMCESCHALIDHMYLSWMLERGQWIPQAPGNPYPSFFLNGLYSPFARSTWTHHAERFLRVKSNPEKFKVFVNTVLCETWEEPGERIESHTLMARLEEYPVDGDGVERVPAGAAVLTAGVDVQGGSAARLEFRVWGWGAGEESWLIRSEQIVGDPSIPPGAKDAKGNRSPWDKLDEMRHEMYTHDGGAPMEVAAWFVDTGYLAKVVYQYCRERVAENVFAVKGVGGVGVHLLGKPTFQGHAKVMLYPVGTFAAKESLLRSRLFIPRGEPGYVHLPSWATLAELEGLVSERLISRLVKGKVVREWVKVKDDARNEALDCQVYAHAALHKFGLGFIAGLGDRATRLMEAGAKVEAARQAQSETPRENESERPAPAPRRRRSGYVNRWRT